MKKIILVLVFMIVPCLALAAGGKLVSTAEQTEKPVSTEQRALFAGGCFWSLEKAFEEVGGVVAAVPVYAGGTT